MPGSTAFITDGNRPQPPRQPPPTACLTASGAASEAPFPFNASLPPSPAPTAPSTVCALAHPPPQKVLRHPRSPDLPPKHPRASVAHWASGAVRALLPSALPRAGVPARGPPSRAGRPTNQTPEPPPSSGAVARSLQQLDPPSFPRDAAAGPTSQTPSSAACRPAGGGFRSVDCWVSTCQRVPNRPGKSGFNSGGGLGGAGGAIELGKSGGGGRGKGSIDGTINQLL